LRLPWPGQAERFGTVDKETATSAGLIPHGPVAAVIHADEEEMIATEVAREARKIPETLEIQPVPCRLPFPDRMSIDASNPLLGPVPCRLYAIAAYKIEMGENPAK